MLGTCHLADIARHWGYNKEWIITCPPRNQDFEGKYFSKLTIKIVCDMCFKRAVCKVLGDPRSGEPYSVKRRQGRVYRWWIFTWALKTYW